jgi:hypothetical protein
MGGLTWVFRPLAVLMLLLSLGAAPLTDALTHGLGALATEADHAAWHAEKGEAWQAAGHQNGDATEHDHSAVIILGTHENEAFDVSTAIELSELHALSGAIREGPKRPPRGGV